jgi:hypothetical protein
MQSVGVFQVQLCLLLIMRKCKIWDVQLINSSPLVIHYTYRFMLLKSPYLLM